MRFSLEYIDLPSPEQPLAPRISSDSKYYPYFEDCLGALEGTHIAATVPVEKHRTFRDRKGNISQNVLAVCSFDMEFLYVLPGWEGSAHDA